MPNYRFHKELAEIGSTLKDIKQRTRSEEPPEETKQVINLSQKLVKQTIDLVDKGFLMGLQKNGNQKSISLDSIFWAQIVIGVLIFFIGVSIGIGYIAIANLESKVYHNEHYGRVLTKEAPRQGD